MCLRQVQLQKPQSLTGSYGRKKPSIYKKLNQKKKILNTLRETYMIHEFLIHYF